MKSNVLEIADSLIHGERAEDYGVARENFAAVAALWRVYLLRRGVITIDTPNVLTPEDVCMMLALLKIARLGTTPDHQDSLVDAIGYLALIEKCKSGSEDDE